MKKIVSIFLIILLSFSLASCDVIDIVLEEATESIDVSQDVQSETISNIKEDGYYTKKEDVSLYIHTYNKLPSNFITKKEASNLGWESSKGNLWDVTEKMSIGGDKFGNREKRLPIKEGRVYYECDINYEGEYRGKERLVYSNDGLVYYTGDHYDSFMLLYGDE